MEEELIVESFVSPLCEPMVQISYKTRQIPLTAAEAFSQGTAILNAAAYAESEAAVYEALFPPSKGFAKPNPEDIEKATMVLMLIRSKRQHETEGVKGIYGVKTQQPLVELVLGDERLVLHLDQARHHGKLLIECAEAAVVDSFALNFFEGKTDTLVMFLKELRLYRHRLYLQNKLG